MSQRLRGRAKHKGGDDPELRMGAGERQRANEGGWEARKTVPQSRPEGEKEDAESSQGRVKDGRDAGTQRQAWPRA